MHLTSQEPLPILSPLPGPGSSQVGHRDMLLWLVAPPGLLMAPGCCNAIGRVCEPMNPGSPLPSLPFSQPHEGVLSQSPSLTHTGSAPYLSAGTPAFPSLYGRPLPKATQRLLRDGGADLTVSENIPLTLSFCLEAFHSFFLPAGQNLHSTQAHLPFSAVGQ